MSDPGAEKLTLGVSLERRERRIGSVGLVSLHDRSLVAWLASRTRSTQLALVVLLFFALLALLGGILAPYSPTTIDSAMMLQPPSWLHPFGTDNFGRDVFSRVVAGTSTILLLSLCSTTLGVAIGTLIGMASGFRGGLIDEVTMRLVDIMMSLPGLLLALLIMSTLGSTTVNLIIGVAVVFVPKSARVARSAVLAVRKLGYVETARLRGQRLPSILLTEVLPNMREVVGVEFCLRLGYGIGTVASLSFLGLGVQPPEPAWGLMISEGRDFITIAPWIVLFPALAIGALVVALNVMADGLWYDRRRFAAEQMV